MSSSYFVTAHTIGGAATTLLVFLGLVAGGVLVTGASLGVLLRRSGKGAAVAGRAVGRGARAVTLSAVRGGQILGEQVRTRREIRDEPTVVIPGRSGASTPLLDGADHFPDLFSGAGTMPPSPALGPTGDEHPRESTVAPRQTSAPSSNTAIDDDDDYEALPPPMETLIPPVTPRRGYRPPSRNVLRRSTGPSTQPASVIQETSRRLVETLGHFGIEADGHRDGQRPACHALRASARARHQGGPHHARCATTSPTRSRPARSCASSLRSPASRPWGSRSPNPEARPGHAGRHHPRVPRARRPADGLARASTWAASPSTSTWRACRTC